MYLRKDITQVTVRDAQSGEEHQEWRYKEAELTLEEYAEYQSELNDAGVQSLKDDNLAIMMAAADSYESSETNALAIMSALAEIYEIIKGGN